MMVGSLGQEAGPGGRPLSGLQQLPKGGLRGVLMALLAREQGAARGLEPAFPYLVPGLLQ